LVKFEEFIKQIFEILKSMGIEFIFSGAIAANVYRTIPRGTMDVDVAIPFTKEVITNIRNKFEEFEFENLDITLMRLEIKDEHPDAIFPEFLRMKHPSGYAVDFLPLYSNFKLKKRKAKIGKLEIEVIGPEDLIILKSIFDRYKDRDDILNILKNKELKIDLDYIIKELKEYNKDEIITLIKQIRNK